METLPTELCFNVINVLAKFPRDLKSLCLTSHRLCAIAQTVLYADIEVHTDLPHEPDDDFISEPRNVTSTPTPFEALRVTIASRPSYFGPMLRSLSMIDQNTYHSIGIWHNLRPFFDALSDLRCLRVHQYRSEDDCAHMPEALTRVLSSLESFECSGEFYPRVLADLIQPMSSLCDLSICFESPPGGLRAGWAEPHNTESDMTALCTALQTCGTRNLRRFSTFATICNPNNSLFIAHGLPYIIRTILPLLPLLQVLRVHDYLTVRPSYSFRGPRRWVDDLSVDEVKLDRLFPNPNSATNTELRTIQWVDSYAFLDPDEPRFNNYRRIIGNSLNVPMRTDSHMIPALFASLRSLHDVQYYSHLRLHSYSRATEEDLSGRGFRKHSSEKMRREELKQKLTGEWPLLYGWEENDAPFGRR